MNWLPLALLVGFLGIVFWWTPLKVRLAALYLINMPRKFTALGSSCNGFNSRPFLGWNRLI